MNTFAHYDKVNETIVEPLESLIMNRLFVDQIDSTTGSNVVIIAGEPIGTGAPPSSDLIIGAPIAPLDGNALRITGVTLAAQFSDSTNPGILSLATQDIVGQKRFTTGIRTNDIDGTAIMSVGDGSTGLILTAAGDIDIDGTGSIDMGTIQSTGINIGRLGFNTTFPGPTIQSNATITTSNTTTGNITTANITTSNITTATVTTANITTSNITTDNITTANITTANITNETVSGTADINNLDRAGVINIGTTNATALTLGRVGVTTIVNGTLQSSNFDRAAGMVIGLTAATISIGNNTCSITANGDWIFQRVFAGRLDSDLIRGMDLGVPMVIGRNSNNGMNLGAEMGAMVIDHFTADASDSLAIGTTRALGITIGRSGQTTTVNSLLSAQGGVQFLTSGGTPAILNDYEEYTHVTTFTLNTQTTGNINLVIVKVGRAINVRCDTVGSVGGQVAPGTNFAADTVLPARFRPSMDCSQLIGITNNSIVTVGRAIIGSSGSISLFAGPDSATTYTTLVSNGFTRFTFAYTL